MTIREKLEPLTRMTVADAQQWCRDNPFVETWGCGEETDCLVEAIGRSLCGEKCGVGTNYIWPHRELPTEGVRVALSPDLVAAAPLFDKVCSGGRGPTAIEAAALMWPEVFADEAKRLVESVETARV